MYVEIDTTVKSSINHHFLLSLIIPRGRKKREYQQRDIFKIIHALFFHCIKLYDGGSVHCQCWNLMWIAFIFVSSSWWRLIELFLYTVWRQLLINFLLSYSQELSHHKNMTFYYKSVYILSKKCSYFLSNSILWNGMLQITWILF